MSTATTTDRPRTPPRRRPQVRRALGVREGRRLLQLCVCLAIFAIIFLGNGVFPSRIATLRENILETIHETTDFKAAFSSLGEAIGSGVPAGKALTGLWTEVFGRGTVPAVPTSSPLPGHQTGKALLAEGVTVGTMLDVLASTQTQAVSPPVAVVDEPLVEATLPPTPTPVPEPTSRPYDGPALPERASMEYVSLGLPATVTPVMGTITSNYGYRDHPIDGNYKFHYGTDIAAETGQAVGAFADGVVEFIGESPAYGLYIQVKHPGGVTSFYAHCSALSAGQGKTVSMGEKIAEVGDTGNATGPHLHLELKRDGIFYDPSYYVETQ